MHEIQVSWFNGRDGLWGKSPSVRKIVFVRRGEGAACCLVPWHSQRCRVLRDTKPEDVRKGAIIVTLLEECQQCARDREVIHTYGPGWSIDSQGRYLAPDGEIYHNYTRTPEDGNWQYRVRCQCREIYDMLTPEFVSEVKALSLPQGPAILDYPADWQEPFEFRCVNEGSDYPRLPFQVEGSPATCVAVHHEHGIGVAWRTGTWEYESEDGMGSRIAGGDMVFYRPDQLYRNGEPAPDLVAELMKFADHPQVTRALAELCEAHATRDARRLAWEAAWEAARTSHGEWFTWYRGLPLAQRLRVLMGEKPEQCEVVPAEKHGTSNLAGWTLRARSTDRRGRSFSYKPTPFSARFDGYSGSRHLDLVRRDLNTDPLDLAVALLATRYIDPKHGTHES